MSVDRLSIVVRDSPAPLNGRVPGEIGNFLNLTDSGNAFRLVLRHGADLRFCKSWNRWLMWDGTRFSADSTQEVVLRAQETVRAMYAECEELPDQEARVALAKHASRSENGPRIREMVTLASAQTHVAIRSADLDADPWLFNAANGTIDLRTGELREHRREDLITKRSPAKYDPEARAPVWMNFLDRIMDGNAKMIEFLQRAFGYSLTGHTGEECFFIAYGHGRNGKSKCFGAIEYVMGDYATHTRPETFTAKVRDHVANDVAALAGARFVPTIEIEDGARLAEGLVKQMTGGDRLTARFLYGEWFSFRPQFKIWLAANHKPGIKGTDVAMWERIKLIPFPVTIPVNERDTHLSEKLEAEAAGILNWAVQGCLAWQKAGLAPPAEVQKATAIYREEMDVLGNFLKERCILRSGAQILVGQLYSEYTKWCTDTGHRSPLSRTGLGRSLRERGLESSRLPGHSRTRYWEGVGLLTEETSDASDELGRNFTELGTRERLREVTAITRPNASDKDNASDEIEEEGLL
jgi:putative DNA primase/helicase